MAKLRLSLTLPGAVSLGAYEGGAVAALVVAAQHLEGELVIDSVAAASAGSITALLAARSLLRGADPVFLMRTAWVEADSLDALRTSDPASPLSFRTLEELPVRLLGPQGVADGPVRQAEPVRVSMALTSLGGLGYRIASLERDTPVDVATYLDWCNLVLGPDSAADDYVAASTYALASGANPLAFLPRVVNRADDRAAYERAGILNFPASGSFWYTDGGTVDNEPLGRTIDLAGEIPGDDPRVFLLVHPIPAGASGSGVWWDTASTPNWTRTLLRGAQITSTQTIYEDLRRLEKVNSRLRWQQLLLDAVGDGLREGLEALDPPARAHVEEALAAALGDALTKAGADRRAIDDQRGMVAGDPPEEEHGPPDATALETLETLVRLATGLEGKAPVRVEIVSPAVDQSDSRPASAQLAGEFFSWFGGFLDVRFRQSDFALGYRNMSTWLRHFLPEFGFSATDTALTAVQSTYDELGWDSVRLGGAAPENLPLAQKVQLARLAGHIARVVVHDVRHWQG